MTSSTTFDMPNEIQPGTEGLPAPFTRLLLALRQLLHQLAEVQCRRLLHWWKVNQ
jgi:hypothetical protein